MTIIIICCLAAVPEIIIHPVNTSAAAPFGGKFKCSAKVYGILSLEWKRVGSDLPNKAMITFKSSPDSFTSVLFIPNVTSSDVGEYQCIASANNEMIHSDVAALQFSGTYVIVVTCA